MRALPRKKSVPAPPQDGRFAANDPYSEVVVGGLRIACLSRPQLALQMVHDCLAARRSNAGARTVFAANGHAIAMAAHDSGFQAMFDAADIVHADGQAIVFASRLLTSTPIPERSATTDFIHDAAAAAVEHGLRFFLFGATEEVNARCAEVLAERYPGIEIVGRRHGYFSTDEEEAICAEINRSGADVVWMGLSVPLEYEFAERNKTRLKVGWIVTCGGCFNYITGHYVRAPLWMQRAGLEWLHRVARDPKRLFWRYAITNPIAAFMLLARTAETDQAPQRVPLPAPVRPAPIAAETRFAQ